MPRPRNREERRAQIVRGLESVMAEQGFERASVARIAKAAGLTPGLVHYHFENKQEILRCLVSGMVNGALDRISNRTAEAVSGREKVHEFLRALLALGEGSDPRAAACWALISAEAIRNVEVCALWARFLEMGRDRLSELITLVCVEEQRSSENAPALAAGLLAAALGYVQIGTAAPGVIPAGTAAEVAVRMANGLLDSLTKEK